MCVWGGGGGQIAHGMGDTCPKLAKKNTFLDKICFDVSNTVCPTSDDFGRLLIQSVLSTTFDVLTSSFDVVRRCFSSSFDFVRSYVLTSTHLLLTRVFCLSTFSMIVLSAFLSSFVGTLSTKFEL